MPYKSLKCDSFDVLTLEWVMQVKNFKLVLDRHRCVGCQICSLVCPKDAVKVEKQLSDQFLKPRIDIDLSKCNFCGVCDVTCLYGAIKVTLNNACNLALLAKESYPTIDRTITLNSNLCPKNCFECEIICPLQLIKVSRKGFDGQPINDINNLSPTEKQRIKVIVDIQKEYCPTCKLCETKCPSKTLKVTKIFEGKLVINSEKCLINCHKCVDICPIPNVLTIIDKKISTNNAYCTYCGACKNVCPVDDALIIKRVKINHKHIHSGTWNKTLERLTNKNSKIKELEAITSIKKRDIVTKRLQDEITHE
ncbi:MAG: 4Fe-4S dicluster domain-containing protein [Candidatus Bathyarchaeota archaeon]|nr:4Fe-4S dicluster domain-containing protein [Candidatus Termiticorpusculum sp.]